MTTFVVFPKYKKKDNPSVQYEAPCFFIDAENQQSATKIAEKSALARFSEWSLHIMRFTPRQSRFNNGRK